MNNMTLREQLKHNGLTDEEATARNKKFVRKTIFFYIVMPIAAVVGAAILDKKLGD